ncbi:Mechanosensitive ion channel [bacterium A37T11]|nr:Mechanosensitive ion channel [bacterium A37T11]
MRTCYVVLALMIGLFLFISAIAYGQVRSSAIDTSQHHPIQEDLFSDSVQLTPSDFQQHIENTYLTFNYISNNSELSLVVNAVRDELANEDSILSVLGDNILHNSRALDIRNLQVFKTLLQNIQVELNGQRSFLDSADKKLTSLRTNFKTLKADTVMHKLVHDTTLRMQFVSQLKELGESWRETTRKYRNSTATINQLQAQVSANMIKAVRLQEKANDLLTTAAVRIFGKEYNYLWERDTLTQAGPSAITFARVYQGEKKALQYYFKDSDLTRIILLFIGALFFWWVMRNLRLMKRPQNRELLSGLKFTYLTSGIWLASLVVTLSVVPLFDIHAPSTYISFMEFLLLLILTGMCWKKWPRKLFWNWVALFVLYSCFSFFQHMADPGIGQRLILILLSTGSVFFGLRILDKVKMSSSLPFKGFLTFVVVLHNFLNVLAILFNIWGRVTLAQILGNAAIFSLMQSIALAVFSQIFMESIQLQVIASRIRLGITRHFDYAHILHSFRSLILFIVVFIWAIIFTNNLNIYTALLDMITGFLHTERQIGNASFTFGGIVLFFLIIWVAHLLQRYVGYFFGDIETEEEVHDKKQRSRMLIIKLVLLCLGYLLAVTASGIPVDKITIVIGALGVGIGLGLQNIVNNFVSGIVLIFDRPLQIGDIVEVGEKTGKVREIGLRSSTLLTGEGAEVIIPNGDILSQKIVNWTLTNSQRQKELVQRISGSTDMDAVTTIIKNAIVASNYISAAKEPQVLFIGIHEHGFDVKITFWSIDVGVADEAASDALVLTYRALTANGLTISAIPKDQKPG